MALKKTFSKKDKTKCTVTFTVTAEAAVGAKTIHLAGDFNQWSSTADPLKKNNKDGSFSIKKDLEVGKEYQFRYLYDGQRWENDWKADDYVPITFSDSKNSVIRTIEAHKK